MCRNYVHILSICLLIAVMGLLNMGCGQIGMPTGGPRDSIAPVLAKAHPQIKSLNFSAKQINLTFDEYVEVNEPQKNIFISPLTKYNPQVNYNLKTVTIKLKDTLKPNTTYTIFFGDAIRDITETNVYKDFKYVFSTGNYLDSLSFGGRVLLAETGKPDSTISVLLYRNADDTAVLAKKPDYMAKVNSKGNFELINLPSGSFHIYALKDGDGGKTYNMKTELFAFNANNKAINIPMSGDSIILYAYSTEKPRMNTTPARQATKVADKKLKYSSNVKEKIDILEPVELKFNQAIKKFDSSKIILTDTNYKAISGLKLSLDTPESKILIRYNWKPETHYRLIVQKDVVDTTLLLAKIDTIKILTRSMEDYGAVVLRFSKIDIARKPVLQFVSGDEIIITAPIKSSEWTNKIFPPGEYEVRILYDTNGNGIWDAGNFKENRQPEIVIVLPDKLAVKANWDNERDIIL